MATKRKRTELDVAMKLRLIDDIESGMKRIEVAQKYGVGKSTLSDIYRAKDKWKSKKEESTGAKFRFVKTKFSDLNQLMLVWFRTARDKNIPISGPLIKAKATQFAEQLNITDFGASDGWLTKWKQRNEIKQVAVCGESGDVDQTIVTEWKSKIADLCAGYQPEEIFNCDETGLYFRALPDRTLAEKQDDVTGIKTSKDRITVMFTCSMAGEILKPMVINRAENPRCFKNIKKDRLPVVWEANRKAWMTGALFILTLRQTKRSQHKAIDFIKTIAHDTLTVTSVCFLLADAVQGALHKLAFILAFSDASGIENQSSVQPP
ncbi:tigger transposable element-derived protein 6-like [Anneissia japonica]|uniref:tigger transposable element-derived protein 6-like n=1 Tax=Anneissia japonica TaxID=1529436 RepID=UPI0014259470|nr:tigger transposable element-derived protein 6-like [Anneissia japonica]